LAQELLVHQSSVKRLEERIQSASSEKNKLEGELMTLQSELKSGKKAKQTLESDNTKLSGGLHFVNFQYYVHL
jgi:prefoldin subunit 5